MSDCSDQLVKLLESHGARLYGLLTRLTLREDVADDLLQELFLKLSRSGGFQRANDPKAYLFRSAINLTFDWRKRQSGGTIASLPAEEPVSAAASPLVQAIRREELDELLCALERLPADSRDLLVMHYVEQESYEEMAAFFGKTSHQMRGLCHKAVNRLRALMNGKPA